jgi:hypothetical protein
MKNPNSIPNVPISWGELIDKITILEIKSKRIVSEISNNNINKELALLTNILNSYFNIADIEIYKIKLKDINEKLWDVEDKIRKHEAEKSFNNLFIELARSVYILNDQRANIKKIINNSFSSEIVEEKSYQNFQL